MADHHTPVTVEHESVDRAIKDWNSFMKFTKYGIFIVTAVLTVMAITLL